MKRSSNRSRAGGHRLYLKVLRSFFDGGIDHGRTRFQRKQFHSRIISILQDVVGERELNGRYVIVISALS